MGFCIRSFKDYLLNSYFVPCTGNGGQEWRVSAPQRGRLVTHSNRQGLSTVSGNLCNRKGGFLEECYSSGDLEDEWGRTGGGRQRAQ